MSNTALAAPVLIELSEDVVVYNPLPACPDGSGDLWWDDASYARYQSHDPYEGCEHYVGKLSGYWVDGPGFCDGRPMIYPLDFAVGHSCMCHTPAVAPWIDPPF